MASIKTAKPVVLRPAVVAGAPMTFTPDTDGKRMWIGEGPPPEPALGIAVGDTYVDKISGQVYRLDPGE